MMTLPDTHEKVIRCLMTCETDEQMVVAKRYAELWRHWLIHLYSNAKDVTSANTFKAYYERLLFETNQIINP